MNDKQASDGEEVVTQSDSGTGCSPLWIGTALIVGVGLVLAVILPVPTHNAEMRLRSNVARVQADMRSMSSAIESYFNNNDAYPAWATGAQGENRIALPTSPAYSIPTFRIRTGPEDSLATLTTPISHSTSYFVDPFAPERRATFAYCSLNKDPEKGTGWILWSPGPDKIYQLDPVHEYRPLERMPSDIMVKKTYDSTNGTTSAGDIWRIKQ